jgi:hypothetical protein
MLGHIEQRKNRRFPSSAQAQIPDAFSGDALLKDISITGCRIECTMNVDMREDTEYRIVVFPEKTSRIGRFDITARCKWILPRDYACDIGFDITKSPEGRVFQRYVDYLTWRLAP